MLGLKINHERVSDIQPSIVAREAQISGYKASPANIWVHDYNDLIMSGMAYRVTSLTIVYSTVYTGADEQKHQSSASLAFVRGIHRWPVNSLHKGPVTRKMFPLDDVIMIFGMTSGSYSTVCILSHYHHYADLTKRIQYIKPLYKYKLPSMCLKLCLFSQLSFMQHMELCFSGGCFRFKRFSFDDCENICISAYYHHHKIKSMNH